MLENEKSVSMWNDFTGVDNTVLQAVGKCGLKSFRVCIYTAVLQSLTFCDDLQCLVEAKFNWIYYFMITKSALWTDKCSTNFNIQSNIFGK